MARTRVSEFCFFLLSIFIASSCGVSSHKDSKYEKLNSEDLGIFHFSSRELLQLFFPKETIEPPVDNTQPPNPLVTVTPNKTAIPVPNTNPGTQPVMPPPAIANVPHNPGQSWCVAKSGAPQAALQAALDYACGVGGVDCSVVQQGGSCYNPVTLENHASYAFNSFYQINPAPTSCDFGGTAMITSTNPSSGSCIFPASSSTSTSVPPPVTQTPTLTPPTPSAVSTPPAFSMPPAAPTPPAFPTPPASPTPPSVPTPPAFPTPPASLRPSASPTPPVPSSGTVPRASGSPVSANSTNNTTSGIPMKGFPNVFPIFNNSMAPDNPPTVTSMSKPRTLPQPFVEGVILLTYIATWNHILDM